MYPSGEVQVDSQGVKPCLPIIQREASPPSAPPSAGSIAPAGNFFTARLRISSKKMRFFGHAVRMKFGAEGKPCGSFKIFANCNIMSCYSPNALYRADTFDKNHEKSYFSCFKISRFFYFRGIAGCVLFRCF